MSRHKKTTGFKNPLFIQLDIQEKGQCAIADLVNWREIQYMKYNINQRVNLQDNELQLPTWLWKIN